MPETKTSTSEIREWARAEGYDVADTGRLPTEVKEAYAEAHGQ